MKQIPQGIPEDPRLKELTPESLTLPAFLQFPNKISLLIKADDDGRAPAVQALQAAMLRFLTAVPPGKVRFTIIDPVGLGENFAAFMHLADYDEPLVTSRIWTEPAQIEQRLADLTEHMENVIQKYLRNQYATIEEYNAQAGEVAEPYRVLVVANFPANFTRGGPRGWSASPPSGASCGVYTPGQRRHRASRCRQGFSSATWSRTAVNLVWKDGQFVWKDADFEQLPAPARRRRRSDASSTAIVQHGRREGQGRQAASRSPFEFIAPPPDAVLDRRQPRAASTSRSAAPGPPSASTCSSARARRSTS